MRAAARSGFIVIFRNEFRDGFGEFFAESRPVRRRPEANLGIHRQGRQAFARLVRTTNEIAHLAAEAGAASSERSRLRIGSKATVAAAGSSMTWMSSIRGWYQ